jgi:hypothetical protein
MNVLSLGALGAGNEVKFNLLARVQGFESIALDGGMMHKHILPFLLADEPKSF